jgi:hypothetical protein
MQTDRTAPAQTNVAKRADATLHEKTSKLEAVTEMKRDGIENEFEIQFQYC